MTFYDQLFSIPVKRKMPQLVYTELLFVTFIVGPGRNHKDAASVRATHPIPTSCGIYYFEVKVISKGRDG